MYFVEDNAADAQEGQVKACFGQRDATAFQRESD